MKPCAKCGRGSTSAALTTQLAEAIQQRADAERQLATLRAVLVARGDGEWDDDKVAAEIERHVAAIVVDHRTIVGSLRSELASLRAARFVGFINGRRDRLGDAVKLAEACCVGASDNGIHNLNCPSLTPS